MTGGDELSEVTGQGSRESVGEEAQVGLGTSIYDGTGETALAEPLLEELLMQSVGEMQFPRTEAGAGYDLFAGEGDGGTILVRVWICILKQSPKAGDSDVSGHRTYFDFLFVCSSPFGPRSVSSWEKHYSATMKRARMARRREGRYVSARHMTTTPSPTHRPKLGLPRILGEFARLIMYVFADGGAMKRTRQCAVLGSNEKAHHSALP